MHSSSSSDALTNGSITFKERKGLPERQRMVQDIMRQHNDKVPLIIERYDKERFLPLMNHAKYLVPSHLTIGGVMQIIRRRLQLHPDQAFYLLVNGKSVFSMSQTIGQLYDDEKDEDGFLYIVYASQPAFGGENARDGEE
uniref:Autophagy-related protein n=2 Tax=Meloidogyne TaxID=189290 RepID=A0A915NQE8_9BILA